MVHLSGSSWGLMALYLLRAMWGAASIDACLSTASDLNISTTGDARALATALNCSGKGVFNVIWEGTVVIDQTFMLTDGSVMTIAGVGLDAVVDGAGTVQLFTVMNATLYLANVELKNGTGSSGDLEVTGWTGGAIWAGGVESSVFCSGNTTFSYNDANNGGAVNIEDGARASWSGQTNFTRNTAAGNGGALRSTCGAMIFTGDTTIEHSFVSEGSSAIYANYSEVSWSGVMSFNNNTASSSFDSGGAVVVYSSALTWEGNTSFKGCSGGYGGALYVSASNVSWGGETEFCDNETSLRGGALSVEESSHVSWTGETRFFNNNGAVVVGVGRGGAIHVDNSTISWNGTTTFTNNSASTGGAVYATGGSTLNWNETTTFSDNSADTGGAVYADGGTTMDWGGTINFFENTASTNGGAVAVGTEVSIEMGVVGSALSLTGNVASIAGGAVYQSGTSKGLTWEGVSFISNSALNGGAVYSVASGTANIEGEEFPTWYINCTFRNNTAAASGGAMESAAGGDIIVNTTFDSNIAGAIGGGLRMAGTTTLTRCDFVGNGANEAGPAVSSVGTSIVANSFFTNNGLLCSDGDFLNFTVEGNVIQYSKDYYDSVCEGCELCTGDCLVEGNGAQECVPALENTVSSGVDDEGVPITLQTLYISSGYWRSISSTTTIRPCWNEDACVGGVTDQAEDCAEEYEGPYCAICKHDYTPTLAYTCSKCSNGEGVAFAVLMSLGSLAVLGTVIFYLASKTQNTKKTRFRKLLQTLPLQGLKIVVVAWQILTQFDTVANVTYAGAYGKFLDGISSIISLDLGLILSAGCVARTDFHDRLLVSTLGPIFALGALGVSFYVATRRNRGSQNELQAAWRKHFSMALLVTFLVYSSVSSTVFRVFDTETLENGTTYLRADYSIDCTTVKHKALEAGFMILLYPLGIPVLYGVILLNIRKALKDRQDISVDQSADLQVTADLWKSYKPTRYYYEVVECLRRVMLTGVVVFIYPNTAAQVAVTLVLAFGFAMVSESLAPYKSTRDAWMSRIAHIVVFLSMFQALVLKVDVSDESSDSKEVFGGVLLAANICMVAAIITEAAMVVYSVCGIGTNDLDETIAPGNRTTASTRSVVETWDMITNEGGSTGKNPAEP